MSPLPPLRESPAPPAPPPSGGAVGLGLGWTRIADAVARRLPVAEVERIWVFQPVRRDDREWGTAVIARRAAPGRLTVYTGSYILFVRGREKGQGRVEVEEVGEGPEDVLADVLRGVQERAGEAEPPGEVPVRAWYDPAETIESNDASAAAG